MPTSLLRSTAAVFAASQVGLPAALDIGKLLIFLTNFALDCSFLCRQICSLKLRPTEDRPQESIEERQRNTIIPQRQWFRNRL